MNAKSENQTSQFNSLKWIAVLILLVGGIVANSYFSVQSFVMHLTGWVVLIGLIAFIAFQTSQGKKAWDFFKNARMELRKVVWPTRQETVQTTLVVICIVVVAALILWGIDSILLWLVSLLTGRG